MKTQKSIVYVAYYDLPEYQHEARLAKLSASPVIEYIAGTLAEHAAEVKIISPVRSLNKCGLYQARQNKINDRINLYIPPSIGVKSRFGRWIVLFCTQLWLMFQLLRTVKRGDFFVVYHSLACMTVVSLVKRLKRARLILETREVYANLTDNEKLKQKELHYIKSADGYIFASELLNEIVNKDCKPFVINYAGYDISSNSTQNAWEDDAIHCVYAGNFSRIKGGAAAAVAAAEFLDSKYHVHILGFGTNDEVECIKQVIKETALKTDCKISFDGCLHGDDYYKFIRKCHIGLSTQTPDGDFNATSFPSKVLSYLSNGLSVVSVRLKVLEKSSLSDSICFYDVQTAEAIAEAIKHVNLKNTNCGIKTIQKLDLKFRESLNQFIKSELNYGTSTTPQ